MKAVHIYRIVLVIIALVSAIYMITRPENTPVEQFLFPTLMLVVSGMLTVNEIDRFTASQD